MSPLWRSITQIPTDSWHTANTTHGLHHAYITSQPVSMSSQRQQHLFSGALIAFVITWEFVMQKQHFDAKKNVWKYRFYFIDFWIKKMLLAYRRYMRRTCSMFDLNVMIDDGLKGDCYHPHIYMYKSSMSNKIKWLKQTGFTSRKSRYVATLLRRIGALFVGAASNCGWTWLFFSSRQSRMKRDTHEKGSIWSANLLKSIP